MTATIAEATVIRLTLRFTTLFLLGNCRTNTENAVTLPIDGKQAAAHLARSC
jgi:hypothetical protein